MDHSPLVLTHYDATELDTDQLQSMATGLAGQLEARYVAEGLTLANADPEAEAISVFVSSAVTAELMAAMPKLELIICRSTGFNNIDLEAAKQRGIAVSNVPTYGVETVAEYTVALVLLLVRRLNLWAKPGDGVGPADLCGLDISGKTVGVVGTGAIGRRFIELIRGFGVTVLAYDIFPNQQAATELGFTYVSLAELLQKSHIVSLHAPATAETHHLINSQTLSQMKLGTYLVNTARGELVHTAALIEALHKERLAGVALDVFEGEKLVWQSLTDDPEYDRVMGEYQTLMAMPQVIVTPHNAFNTEEAIGRINQETMLVIEDWMAGRRRNQV